MQDLGSSFIRGANFVRQAENEAHNRKRQAQFDEQSKQRHQATLRNLDAQYEHNQSRQKEWEGGAEHRRQMEDLQLQNAKDNQAYTKQDRERLAVENERQDIEWQQNQDARLTQENLQYLKSVAPQEMFRLKKTGQLDPEFYHRAKDTPFDIGRALDPEIEQRLDFLSAALDPKDKRASPKDPRFIKAFNDVFAPEINRNLAGSTHPTTGAKAVKKEIINAVPVEGEPGKYYAQLRVTYADGSVREEPMTKGRDNNPDAELSTVDIGDMVQMVSARKMFGQLVRNAGVSEQYGEYESYMRQRQQSGKTPDYKGKTVWRGQQVHTKEVLDEFKEMQVSRFSDDGTTELISFDDWLWTEGDPLKQGIVRQVAQENRRRMAENQMLESDEQLPLIDYKQAYQLEMQNRRGTGGQRDPNEGVLAGIINPGERVNQADEHIENPTREKLAQRRRERNAERDDPDVALGFPAYTVKKAADAAGEGMQSVADFFRGRQFTANDIHAMSREELEDALRYAPERYHSMIQKQLNNI